MKIAFLSGATYLSLFVLAGCNYNNASASQPSAPPPGPSSPDKDTSSGNQGNSGQPLPTQPPVQVPGEGQLPPGTQVGATACYPGKTSKTCLPLERLSGHSSTGKDYAYLDPYQDSSFPKSANPSRYTIPINILNLQTIDLKTYISKNYQLQHFLSTGKGPLGIISPEVIERLELMTGDFGKKISFTSGYRSPGYNSAIKGSAKWSRHLYGDGLDFYVSGVSMNKMHQICEKRGGFALDYTDGHLHCDWRSLELNRSYFGGGGLPITLSKAEIVAQLFAEAAIEIYETASGIEIATTGLPNEEGHLAHYWEIANRDTGEIWSSLEPIVLTKLPPGSYGVRVRVGGQFTLDREFSIR